MDYDVLAINSLLWPYRIVIQYTLPIGMSKDYKKREDAEQNSKADLVIRNRYKNVYEFGDKGLRISDLLSQQLNGEWRGRMTAFDACWDNLPSISADGK